MLSLRRLSAPELRFLRKYTGMSTSMLAERLRVSDDDVNAWEDGVKRIPIFAEARLRSIVLREKPIERYEFTLGRSREPKVAYASERKRWRRDGSTVEAHA